MQKKETGASSLNFSEALLLGRREVEYSTNHMVEVWWNGGKVFNFFGNRRRCFLLPVMVSIIGSHCILSNQSELFDMWDSLGLVASISRL